VVTISGGKTQKQRRGPPNPYLDRPISEIQERINGLEKLVKACEDVLADGKPTADKIEAEGMDKLTEEEITRWEEIKAAYSTAKHHLWQNQQDLKWYREALSVQENNLELNTKLSSSTHSSLVTLIKKVDVDQKKESLACRHAAEQDMEQLDIEIEDLKGKLAMPSSTEETAVTESKIQFLKEKKQGIQSRMEAKLRRIEESANVKEKVYPHQ